MSPTHHLVILLGDAGVGKSRLAAEVSVYDKRVGLVASDTTRPRRTDHMERAYLDQLVYRFITEERFQANVARGLYAFESHHLGHYYGVRQAAIDRVLRDRHGILSMLPSAVAIMRQQPYPVHVVWVEATGHEDRRSAERRAFDEAQREITIQIDYRLTNSFGPLGIDEAVLNLRKYIASLS